MSGFTPEMRDKAAQTRRMNAEERRRNAEAAGIPDSRPFVVEGSDPIRADKDAEAARVLSAHINGVLVSDLPEAVQQAARWDWTDEGIAERNAGRTGTPGVAVGAEPADKAVQERRDNLRERKNSYEARDPMKDVADAHALPGMRPKFLSARNVRDGGGSGDYEVVRDSNGDPVKYKGMLLGHVAEEVAQARNKHFQERGNQMIRQVKDKYQQEGGRTAVVDQ
jgi:hypothetical protein